MRVLVAVLFSVGLGMSPAWAAKLDNANAPAAGTEAKPQLEMATGSQFFAATLPLTSALMEAKFAADRDQIAAGIDPAMGGDTAARITAMVDNLTRVAINYELKILDAPDDKTSAIIDGQAAYVQALLDGEGADTCAPIIFDGSTELIGRGLYEKYAPQIDATMAAYFDAVRDALDNPSYVGDMTADDNAAVIGQMTDQGDKDLMDHFGVMTKESPKNCPAILALIKAAHAVDGQSGIRFRAQQARGASRL